MAPTMRRETRTVFTPISSNELACQQIIECLQPAVRMVQHCDLTRLKELWEIDREAYGDCSLEFSEFQTWWNLYELGSRILIEDNKIVASIGIYPILYQQAESFVQGQICEGDLLPVSLEICDQQPQNYWYVSGIVVARNYRGWGSPLRSLMRMGIGLWLSSGHLSYPLTLFAIGEYEDGARLLKLIGFSLIRCGEQTLDGYDIYCLKLQSEIQARQIFERIGL